MCRSSERDLHEECICCEGRHTSKMGSNGCWLIVKDVQSLQMAMSPNGRTAIAQPLHLAQNEHTVGLVAVQLSLNLRESIQRISALACCMQGFCIELTARAPKHPWLEPYGGVSRGGRANKRRHVVRNSA